VENSVEDANQHSADEKIRSEPDEEEGEDLKISKSEINQEKIEGGDHDQESRKSSKLGSRKHPSEQNSEKSHDESELGDTPTQEDQPKIETPLEEELIEEQQQEQDISELEKSNHEAEIDQVQNSDQD
jgi:hypothetical protein